MASSYVGKAALTMVRVDNTLAYVYAGEPVPGGADEADVARLVAEGFIVPLAFPAPEPVEAVAIEDEVSAKPARKPSSRSAQA